MARSDGTLLDGRVFSLLDRSRLARLPLVRSLVALAEMIVFVVRLRRRNGLHPNLRLLGWLALWLVVSSLLDSLLYRLVGAGLLGDAVAQLASLLLGLGCLQRGMGLELWRYHGAEHKAVNAYEAGADLDDLGAVTRYSRIHDRCGSNLVAIILVASLAYLPLARALPGFAFSVLYSLLAVAVAFELFRLVTRRPKQAASRLVLFAGKALQRTLTTREPDATQLRLACRALRRVVTLEGRSQNESSLSGVLEAGHR